VTDLSPEFCDELAELVLAWLATADVLHVAWVHGAAFQLMASAAGVTEAELYADFARRAAADPDCQIVR
jgi:hypothetical protein